MEGKTVIPDFQDEVRHITAGISGTVIATYKIDNVDYLDVRTDDHVFYETKAVNWVTTAKCDE